jgi:hypothetical protein
VSLVQTEGEVETLRVVVPTIIFNGQGISPEPVNWVLLHVVLGDSERPQFLGEKQIAKSWRVGREAFTNFGSLLSVADLVDPMVGIVAAVSVAGGVAVGVASASAIAATTSSSTAAIGGTAATAAPAAAATAPTAVAAVRGSSRRGSRDVGCWLVFTTDRVVSAICWGVAATSGFVVSSRSDYVVDPHEVGILSNHGDDFTCAVHLGLSCYRGDGHEALLRDGVHSVGDLIQSLVEVPDGESFPKMSALIVPFPIAVAPSVHVLSILVWRCVGCQLIL